MINANLVLRIGIYTQQQWIQFLDNTDYLNMLPTPLTDLSEVTGLIKATSPLGLFYAGGTWAKPDIDPDNISGNGRYKNLPMQFDSNGNFLCGVYTFEYHVMTFDPKTITPFPIISASPALRQFVVAGDASLVTGTVSCAVAPGVGNAGGYTIVSAVYDGVTYTTITVNEDIPIATGTSGTFYYMTPLTEYTWDGANNTTALSALKFSDYLCFTIPNIRLDLSGDCPTSALSATDVTDYRITNNGVQIDVASVDRTMTFKYPTTLQTLLPDIVRTHANVTEVVNPICTKVWKVRLETTANYQLSLISSLHLELFGSDTIEVECSLCICQLYECITALVLEYRNALKDNPSLAERYWEQIRKVLMYKMEWDIAERCGKVSDMEKWCRKIEKIVKSSKCTCDIGTSQYSTWIIPISGLVIPGGGGGSHIIFLSSAPTTQGSDGDTCILTVLPYTVYYKTGGAWIPQFNLGISGLPGSQVFYLSVPPTTQGIDGDTAILKVFPFTIYYKTGGSWVAQFNLSGSFIIYNPSVNVGTPNTSVETALITDTLVANQLAKDGDAINVKAVINLAQNDDDKVTRIYFDAAPIFVNSITGALITSSNDYVEINLDIDRIAATTINVSYTVLWKGGIIDSGIAQFTVTNLSGAHTVNLTGQCQLNGGGAPPANDIVLQKFRVTYFKS